MKTKFGIKQPLKVLVGQSFCNQLLQTGKGLHTIVM